MSTGSIAGAAVCQVQPAQEQRIDKRTGDGHDNISGSRMSWSGESYRNKTIMQKAQHRDARKFQTWNFGSWLFISRCRRSCGGRLRDTKAAISHFNLKWTTRGAGTIVWSIRSVRSGTLGPLWSLCSLLKSQEWLWLLPMKPFQKQQATVRTQTEITDTGGERETRGALVPTKASSNNKAIETMKKPNGHREKWLASLLVHVSQEQPFSIIQWLGRQAGQEKKCRFIRPAQE